MSIKKRSVKFKALGKQHELRFTINNMVAFQEATGEDLMKVIEGFEAGDIDLKKLRALFWAGLGQTEMSHEEAGDIMDDLGFQEALEAIFEAVNLMLPSGNEGTKAGNVKAAPKPRPKA